MNIEKIHTFSVVDDENTLICEKLLRQIISMTERITCEEGNTKTIIPFLTINRHTYPSPLTPSVLTPSFCIILQGMKELHLGKDMIYYYAGDYLASLIDIPASGQVINASVDSPFIGLRIDFTTKEIASVAMEIEIDVKQNKKKPSTGAFVGKSDVELLDLFIRLLKLIDNPKGINFFPNT